MAFSIKNIFKHLYSLTALPFLLIPISCTIQTSTPIEFACLGDSILYYSNLDLYVSQEMNYDYIDNFGICGSSISKKGFRPLVDRYNVISKNTKIICVEGGYNDCICNLPIGKKGDTSTETFYGALNYLLCSLKNEYTSSWIFFITPFYYPNYEPLTGKIDQYVNVIREKCSEFNIPLLDLFSELFDFNPNIDTFDGLHPTLEWSKCVFAPTVSNFIRENYRR